MKNDMRTAALLATVSTILIILFAVTGSLTLLIFSVLFMIGSQAMEYQCEAERHSKIRQMRFRKQYLVQQEREYWKYREELIAQRCAKLRGEE